MYNNFHQDLKHPLLSAARLAMSIGGNVPSNTLPANVVAMINNSGNNIVCNADDALDNNNDQRAGGSLNGTSRVVEALTKKPAPWSKPKKAGTPHSNAAASDGVDDAHKEKDDEEDEEDEDQPVQKAKKRAPKTKAVTTTNSNVAAKKQTPASSSKQAEAAANQVRLQGVSAVGALYCDNDVFIVGEPVDGVLAVAFPNTQPKR